MARDRAARWGCFHFDFQRLLFLVLLAILCYLVLPPLFFTIQSSLYVETGLDEPRLSINNYTGLFSTPGTAVVLLNSLWFALGSSLVALALGTLLAWIVERTDTPFKNLAYLSAFASFAIPGIVKVIGWIMLFGPEKGLINVWLKEFFNVQHSLFNIFTLTGMILVEGMVWAPVVFLFMAAPFRSMDPSLEESALMSRAGPIKTFYHVTLKLALPSVLSVLLLTFVRALEAFEIPILIGIPGRVLVLTSEIYLKLSSGLLPQYGMASAYGVVLISLVSIGLYFYAGATREAQKFYTITGKGFRPRLIEMGKWRHVTTIIVFILPALLAMPLLILAWISVLPYYMAPSVEALRHLSIVNYTAAFQSPNVWLALKNSLIISLSSASLTMLLTAVIAWVVIRSNVSGKGVLEHLASFTLAFPSVVLAVAMLLTYLKLPVPVYGTIWILVLGYITRYIPYGLRYCSPGLLQINKELEESAEMSGAPWSIVFRRIVLPLMMPSIFAGWIYIFLLSVRELTMALLLYSPGSQVISVTIFKMWDFGTLGELSAFSVSVSVLLVGLALIFHRLSRRYGLRV
jgi:iron(III) transport system permease protein